MRWINLKPGDFPQGDYPAVEAFCRNRRSSSTLVADYVLMIGLGGEVIDRRPMPEMAMNNQSRLLQGVKRSIYGGSVNRGGLVGSNALEDPGCGEMLAVPLGHYRANGAPWRGDAQSLAAQSVQKVIPCDVHHSYGSEKPSQPGRARRYSSYLTMSRADRLRDT